MRLKGDASEIGIVRIEADPFFAISVTAAAIVLGMRKSSSLFNAVVTREIKLFQHFFRGIIAAHEYFPAW